MIKMDWVGFEPTTSDSTIHPSPIRAMKTYFNTSMLIVEEEIVTNLVLNWVIY